MIDFSNEVFTRIANAVGDNVMVLGEYVETPSEFPCVTVDEIFNIPANLDSGEDKYADVTYRIQVFSNKKKGKRAEARKIYSEVADVLYELNLMVKTYTTTPTVYNSQIYEIQATAEGCIRKDGTMFRR